MVTVNVRCIIALNGILHFPSYFVVSESHILEDVNKCVLWLQEGDADALDRTAGAIRGRCARVANVVTAEMDNYEHGTVYTDRVMEAVSMLRDQGMQKTALLLSVLLASFVSSS